MRTILGMWFGLIAFTMATGLAKAADSHVVELERLVNDVVENNPELKFYQQEVAAAKGDSKAAGAWANPELETSLDRKKLYARGGGFEAEGKAWAVSVTQTFEYPGRLGLRKAIADGDVRLAKLALERFKLALAAKARLIAFELLGKQEVADAARKISLRSQELISVLVQREPGGVTPLLETRIIQASAIELRKKAIEAERQAQAALYSLNQLRGKPLSSPIEIAATDIKLPTPPDLENVLSLAAGNNLDLQAQRVELEKQGFKVMLSKNERWPSVSIGPYYSEERLGEEERTVGISLSLPIPLWNQNAGAIQSNSAREQQARTSLLVLERQIERDVREKVATYNLLLAEMKLWEPEVSKQLRDAAALGDKHYRLGAVPLSTYLELQERYLGALDVINQTKLEALQVVHDLEYLSGQSLLQVDPLSSKGRLK